MSPRRIETRASQTADITCGCRALSNMERNPLYKSDDWVAPLLLPRKMQIFLKLPFAGKILRNIMGPKGMYEWVVARTKYIDGQFAAISERSFNQVLILGGGFDSRTVRFATELAGMHLFEMDAGTTQIMKTKQFAARGIALPENLTLISINFDLEPISVKLENSGFVSGVKTFVLLEGVLQYLKPESVSQLFSMFQHLLGGGSVVLCDYAHSQTFQENSSQYGQEGMLDTLARYGESWQFALDESEVGTFFAPFGFKVLDRKSPRDLELAYFTDKKGRVTGRVNGTQSIVILEKAN